MSFEVFPYTNFHEMNLDWLIEKMKELVKEWMDVGKKWEEIRELIENFLEQVAVDISAEVKKQLKVMLDNGELEAIITSSLGIVTSVDTCIELKKSTKYKVGQVIVTKGYHKIGDNGGATYYLSDTAFEDTGVFEKTANGLFANMLYNDVISVEQLGVVSNATGDYVTKPANNAVAFNNALSLCKSNSTRKHKFKLVGYGNYYVETTLDFGGTNEAKVSDSDFKTDFSGSTIFTDKSLDALISIKNALEIIYNFGYINAKTCNYGIKITSLERYDWSQYVTLHCLDVRASTKSLYVTNNDKGGWVNELHVNGGLFANGIFVDCPNPKDEVFVTNMLSGFYFNDVSCEGADVWYNFKNVVGVHITSARTTDITNKWITTQGNTREVLLFGDFKSTHLQLSQGTQKLRIFGALTIPDKFVIKNPTYMLGAWCVDYFPQVVEQGSGNGFFRDSDVSPTYMLFKGDCSKVKLPKEYSEFLGINSFKAYVEDGATGTIMDAYGKTVMNVANYQGKYISVDFVGRGWWIS